MIDTCGLSSTFHTNSNWVMTHSYNSNKHMNTQAVILKGTHSILICTCVHKKHTHKRRETLIPVCTVLLLFWWLFSTPDDYIHDLEAKSTFMSQHLKNKKVLDLQFILNSIILGFFSLLMKVETRRWSGALPLSKHTCLVRSSVFDEAKHVFLSSSSSRSPLLSGHL